MRMFLFGGREICYDCKLIWFLDESIIFQVGNQEELEGGRFGEILVRENEELIESKNCEYFKGNNG